MSRASNLTRMIESFLRKSLNEGDMDGDVVVEGTDWQNTAAKFRKAVEQAGIQDHDDMAFDEVVSDCVNIAELEDFDPDSCIMSLRTAKRGKTKYYDYLVRVNFKLPENPPNPEELDRVEMDIIKYLNRSVKPNISDWVRDFGFNVKRKKKDNILSCKFVFKLEKRG